MRLLPFACLFAALVPGAATAADYRAGDGSSLGFTATYQGEDLFGRFATFAATVSFDPARPAACRFAVDIDLGSVAADMDDVAETLVGDEFFAVDTAAKATWRAQACRTLPGGGFLAEGELTLRGITRPAPLTFRWTPGAAPVLDGDASVQRLQHGVGVGDWADVELIADGVRVTTRLVLQPVR